MNYHDDEPEKPDLLPVGTKVTLEGVIRTVEKDVGGYVYSVELGKFGAALPTSVWVKAELIKADK